MKSSLLRQPSLVPVPTFATEANRESQRPAHRSDYSSNPQSAQPLDYQSRLFRNQYVIIHRLGQGGFGTTYFAKDISAAHPLPCVIKQLKYKSKTPIELERSQRRFQREARMMARLGNHSQLPGLLSHFTDDGKFYLVQEHVPGLTISQEVNREGVQTEAQVKQFLREMIPVIRHVHRQSLLHLDIKPPNIIRRSDDDKLVLIDFGAVRRASDEEVDVPVKKRRCAGTIGFSPREQLEGMPTYASDIYALGVTCLYLLTAISPLDLALSPKGQNLRWQDSIELSPYFNCVLAKMLHPDAARRFQNTYELERALNLEPHYEVLKECLTTEAITDQRFAQAQACRLATPLETGSRAQRQAQSIKEWKQHRRQFKTFTPK